MHTRLSESVVIAACAVSLPTSALLVAMATLMQLQGHPAMDLWSAILPLSCVFSVFVGILSLVEHKFRDDFNNCWFGLIIVMPISFFVAFGIPLIVLVGISNLLVGYWPSGPPALMVDNRGSGVFSTGSILFYFCYLGCLFYLTNRDEPAKPVTLLDRAKKKIETPLRDVAHIAGLIVLSTLASTLWRFSLWMGGAYVDSNLVGKSKGSFLLDQILDAWSVGAFAGLLIGSIVSKYGLDYCSQHREIIVPLYLVACAGIAIALMAPVARSTLAYALILIVIIGIVIGILAIVGVVRDGVESAFNDLFGVKPWHRR